MAMDKIYCYLYWTISTAMRRTKLEGSALEGIITSKCISVTHPTTGDGRRVPFLHSLHQLCMSSAVRSSVSPLCLLLSCILSCQIFPLVAPFILVSYIQNNKIKPEHVFSSRLNELCENDSPRCDILIKSTISCKAHAVFTVQVGLRGDCKDVQDERTRTAGEIS